jgi:hypothetical protein
MCVHGQEQNDKLSIEGQGQLRFYWVDKPETIVQTEVIVVNITPKLVRVLLSQPDEIYNLSPEMFEDLLLDRLLAMGFGVSRVGKHTNQKDGGVDIIAWPERLTFPFLMGIQAKHHRSPVKKTGPGPVRELQGAVQNFGFNAGVLVTNTTFTPDAQWAAKQQPLLVRLRDLDDIQRWLKDDFLDEYDWREMPEQVEVCPGITIQIPKPKIISSK